MRKSFFFYNFKNNRVFLKTALTTTFQLPYIKPKFQKQISFFLKKQNIKKSPEENQIEDYMGKATFVQ